MISYQKWKSDTERGLFTPRSDKLKAIDKALEAYERARKQAKGTQSAEVALCKAVTDWLAAKGTHWKSSTRNKTGTVETLVKDLAALNRQFAVNANKYLAQTFAAPPALMVHGQKVQQKDIDGSHHEIPIQSEENSCGPCSVRMVIKLVKNKDVGEEYLRTLVEVAEDSASHGSSLGQGGVVTSGGTHDWSATGGGTWMVPAVLEAEKIGVTRGNNPTALLSTSKMKPAIAVVAWTNGGLHYVVAAGLNRARNALIILDPFYGAQSVPVTGNTLGNYRPVVNNAVQAEATWHPWTCIVT